MKNSNAENSPSTYKLKWQIISDAKIKRNCLNFN